MLNMMAPTALRSTTSSSPTDPTSRTPNSAVTPEKGEPLVSAGKIDGIFIGFNYITHPDVVERILHGKPFNNIPDIPHLQTNATETNWSTGCTDYPRTQY